MKLEHKDIHCSGVFIIESRLDQNFYDYTTGVENFDFGRIAEAILGVIDDNKMSDKIELHLDETIKIAPKSAAKFSRQLMVVVNGVDENYKKRGEKFQEEIMVMAAKIARRLVSKSHRRICVEIGGECIIVTDTDDL